MNEIESLPYRPNVCMLVFNSELRLFLAERHGHPGVWQFPQGGVERKYSLEENVLRELHEELGAERDLFRIERRCEASHQYDFRNPPEYAIGKWRGQDQSFWLVEFSGNDSDIQLDRFEQELMDWKWCTTDEVRQLAEPRRVKGYAKALVEFEVFRKERLCSADS